MLESMQLMLIMREDEIKDYIKEIISENDDNDCIDFYFIKEELKRRYSISITDRELRIILKEI